MSLKLYRYWTSYSALELDQIYTLNFQYIIIVYIIIVGINIIRLRFQYQNSCNPNSSKSVIFLMFQSSTILSISAFYIRPKKKEKKKERKLDTLSHTNHRIVRTETFP